MDPAQRGAGTALAHFKRRRIRHPRFIPAVCCSELQAGEFLLAVQFKFIELQLILFEQFVLKFIIALFVFEFVIFVQFIVLVKLVFVEFVFILLVGIKLQFKLLIVQLFIVELKLIFL